MSDATKSLAAEIEAVSVETLAEAIRRQVVLLRFNEARTLDDSFDADEIELLCIRAANAVKDHVTDHPAAEIAALQSRAFEDGARWRLAEALAVYDAVERDLTAAEAVYQDTCQRMGDEPDMGEIMDRVGAEQACMRCSMAKGIARADLVSAVRAALSQPTPTTEDKGREDRAS